MKSSITELSRNSLLKKDLPYIVKDDFITKLKQPRPKKSKSVKTEPMTSEVGISSLMVNRKKQIFSKMKNNSANDFYDLDRQIQANQHNLYRKMNIILRKQRLNCKIKMNNPFLTKRPQKQSFNQQKQLSNLIYHVQPYWIKRSVIKPLGKQPI